MSILVIGSVALDTVRTPYGRGKEVLGGSATYFSVSARYFSPVKIVAVIGEDFPALHLAFFRKRGIDTRGLMKKEGKTFRWEGEYTGDMSEARTVATHLNVFAEFDPVIPEEYKKTPHVFLANIDPQIQERVLRQIPRPRLVVSDTMNYWIRDKRSSLLKQLRNVDIALFNEGEAQLLSGYKNIVTAAQAILKMGPAKVIVKRGEHGALLFSKNDLFCTSAFLLEKVVDPTGAGDTFAGGVVGYLSRCKRIDESGLRKALVYGNVMASFTVEDFSLNRLACVKHREIKQRVSEYHRRHRL